jgi:probable phosphoglycerate mutase
MLRRVSIYLIRHGETAANAARILQRADVPLSERGVAQVGRLAERLARAGIARILSSDLARAVMTAEALSTASGVAPELDPLLQERNFGDLRGSGYAELGFDPFAADYTPPGGESWERFHDRVAQAWERVLCAAAACEGHLAVVTHGLVCRGFVTRHAEHADVASDLARRPCANTALTVLEGPAPWRVTLLNCIAHLDAGGDARSPSTKTLRAAR